MFKYFTKDEFVCQATGENEIEDELILALDELREHCGFPFIITSGYRCESHPESKKNPQSSHIKGLAADILVKNSRERAVILAALMNAGFSRFGIGHNFIHVDLDEDKIQGVIWTY